MRRMLLLAGVLGPIVAVCAVAMAETSEQYLIAAQADIQAHATAAALADVDHAEAIVRAGQPSGWGLRELGLARTAILRGDWVQAEDYMGEAMEHRSVSEIDR